MMTVQEKLYTVEEFWEIAHLPENDEKRLELVEGVIYAMPPAGGEHGENSANLLISLGVYIRQHNLGHVTAAETGYILFANEEGKPTVRAPDVGYISYERMPGRLPAKYIPLPPDLAIEVVSPNDKAEDIEAKISDYLRAGVRMVVFFYPASKTANVYKGNDIARLSGDDVLDFGDVLPGFSLRLSDVF
ncbi:MAG: Uma2 family endonuclease [Anaerolineae bacterium]